MIKRLFALILCFCVLASCYACVGRRNQDGADVTESETQGAEDIPAGSELIAWTTHSFTKTITNAKPSKEGKTTDYSVYLAKGESEGCQVAVYSSVEMKKCVLRCASGSNADIGVTVYSMNRSHEVGRKQYTDSLILYSERKITLEEKTVLPFMIEFKTSKDTPAGDYPYVYEFVDSEGRVLATFNINVHVWDITLPENKTFVTGAGLAWSWINKSDQGCNEEVYKRWYDSLLDHNICAFDLPYDELDSRADAYMSDPRVTSFRLPIPENEDGTINEEELLKYYQKLKTNPEWLEKAFFYPIDEPRTLEHLAELRAWEEKLTAICPEIEVCVPYYTNIQVGAGKDQTDEMSEYIDLWCPKLCLWDDVKSYGEYLDYTPSESYADRMKTLQESGDRVWCYVCNDPDDPYAQMFIDTEGVNQRLMFWQMYQRDIEGFLYWSVNYYGYVEGPNYEGEDYTLQDPWRTVNTKIPNGDGGTIYGCGFLFYPGRKVGISGPVPSIRAKIVRDGVDDIELFYLAEAVLGKDWLLNKTMEGTSSLTSYTDPDTFAALRIEIGNALEAAK